MPLLRASKIIESIDDLKNEFHRLYYAPERLKGRIYWAPDEGRFRASNSTTEVHIPELFIESVQKHIRSALVNGYADFPIYSDMGHAHLLIPIKDRIRLSQIQNRSRRLEEILKLKDLKLLYHTAELMRLRQGSTFKGPVTTDPWLAWRYHARNFLGENDPSKDLVVKFGGQDGGYNTVRSIPGYSEVEKIYFSAHKNGCFSVEAPGGEIFIDITFTHMPGVSY